jgi:hypothetical protein
MKITFFQPLSLAWRHMTTALFRPFDIGKWFVVGFTVFLAELLDTDPFDGPHHFGLQDIEDHTTRDIEEFLEFPGVAWQWLQEHTFWLILIIFGIVVIFIILLLLTWLSSRGAFMFLDNVVNNRALVSQPWHQFKKIANSVFLWWVFFGFIIGTFVGSFAVILFMIIGMFQTNILPAIPIFLIIAVAVIALFILIVLGYISMFLNNFVIPIMYTHDVQVLKGWKKFLELFRTHAGYFIVYGLLLFLLHIVVVIMVILAGFLTCCIGFILLIIPYISSVILLPISYTFRAFSLEFLEQFGPEYKIFPQTADEPQT